MEKYIEIKIQEGFNEKIEYFKEIFFNTEEEKFTFSSKKEVLVSDLMIIIKNYLELSINVNFKNSNITPEYFLSCTFSKELDGKGQEMECHLPRILNKKGRSIYEEQKNIEKIMDFVSEWIAFERTIKGIEKSISVNYAVYEHKKRFSK